MTCPSISSASIFLAFLLKDAAPLDTPYHLPQTRAIADILQHEGLTIQDYAHVLLSKTPVIADSEYKIPSHLNTRRTLFSDEFSRVVRNSPIGFFNQLNAYSPCVLTGRWEGQYMVNSTSHHFLYYH
jgi:hypothetical protein